MLDELLLATVEADEDRAAAPSLHVDLLAQIERLQSENAALFGGDVTAAAYQFFAGDGAPPVEDAPPPPAADREAIARELGLGDSHVRVDLDRARRAFAFTNHPDRVPAHLRDLAMKRMQIANMLIDEAKRATR
jgi:hypothetical protein